MVCGQILAVIMATTEITKFMTEFWRKKILEIATLSNSVIGQRGWQGWHAVFFHWWLKIAAWCHFRVTWHDQRNHNFTHSLNVNKKLSPLLFSLLFSNSQLFFSLLFFKLCIFYKLFKVRNSSTSKLFHDKFCFGLKLLFTSQKKSFLISSYRLTDPVLNRIICGALLLDDHTSGPVTWPDGYKYPMHIQDIPSLAPYNLLTNPRRASLLLFFNYDLKTNPTYQIYSVSNFELVT